MPIFAFDNGHRVELNRKGQWVLLDHRTKESIESALVLNHLGAKKDSCAEFMNRFHADLIANPQRIGLLCGSAGMDVDSKRLYEIALQEMRDTRSLREPESTTNFVGYFAHRHPTTELHRKAIRKALASLRSRRGMMQFRLAAAFGPVIERAVWDSPVYKRSDLTRFYVTVAVNKSGIDVRGSWSTSIQVLPDWHKGIKALGRISTQEGLLILDVRHIGLISNVYVMVPVNQSDATRHVPWLAQIHKDGHLTEASREDLFKTHPQLWRDLEVNT